MGDTKSAKKSRLCSSKDTFALKSSSSLLKSFKNPFKSPISEKKLCSKPLFSNSKQKAEHIETMILSKELQKLSNELDKQISFYKKKKKDLLDAIKIIKEYEKEVKIMELQEKWRNITIGAMSYILNSTLCKIDRMGGYEEFRRKEIESEKRKVEFQLDNGLEEEFESIVGSEAFRNMPEDDQQEYKERMDEKMKEMQMLKEKTFSNLELQMNDCVNKEFDMKELARRLKVDYSLMFP